MLIYELFFQLFLEKISKSVTIDDFIRFNLDKLSARTDLQTNDTLYLQVGNAAATTGDTAVTSSSAYFKLNGKYVQQLSIIAQVSNGKITGFSWDHQWVDCSADQWLTDPNGNQNWYYTTCTNWDPNIFLTWSGDDGSGFYMMSDAFRISQFKAYMIDSYYSNALKP